MHDGHRERLKERYLANGFDGFADHEVLELVLFYAIPRKDTNPIAHALLEHFGSLSAVFEASADELQKVNGIGLSAAVMLTAVPQLFRRYSFDRIENKKQIASVEAAGEYLVSKFFGMTVEKIALLCLDSKGNINNFSFVADGSLKTAQIDVRKVAETAIRNNADTVIISHNHPNGLPTPSKNDVATTAEMVKIFNVFKIKLADHIIVSDNDYFSMASQPKFAAYFMQAASSLAAESGFSLYNGQGEFGLNG